MLENALGNKTIGTKFLTEIIASCERIFSSILPNKKKVELCGDIILHDYSSLSPENYRDIRTFANALFSDALRGYQENLAKTEQARKVRGKNRKVIRGVKHIVHVDRELDDLGSRMRNLATDVNKANGKDYYKQASMRSKRKFKVSVNKLVSGIEGILDEKLGE
jgi:hypothetical protein